MPRKIGILVIHGMGSQGPGYADGLIGSVESRLGAAASRLAARSGLGSAHSRLGDQTDRLVWKEVHWADALRKREERLQRDMTSASTPGGMPIGLRWRRTREFVVHNFGDAIAYHRDSSEGSAYRLIHDLVSASLRQLGRELDDPDAPVVVLAHSLGAHIMSNYIWDSQLPDGHPRIHEGFERIPMLTSMITYGCNIPLFSLTFDVARPIILPGPEMPDGPLRHASRWINLIDADDVLAWPLRPLYARHIDRLSAARRITVDNIEDRMVDAGGILRAWNPTSHTAYDTDHDLARIVAEHLGELLDALDRLDGVGRRISDRA